MNAIKDLSVLTTIPEKFLTKLIDKLYYIVNNDVLESILEDKTDTEIDLGIGVLTIRCCENEVKYRFTPSSKLDSTIKDTVINKENLLSATLEKNLVEKTTDIYTKEYI